MRVIVVGCEYTGVTTLIEGLMDWGHERDINHHLDDHFTIPDRQHLAPEDRETMVNLSPALKERFQRMQLVYHIRLMHRFDHILLGGFHIEEAIYGPLYYYPGGVASEIRQYEEEMPKNAILVHLTASPEVIQKRMETNLHEYCLIKTEDIPMLLDRFQEEFDASLIPNKIQIETSDLTPETLLETFLSESAQFAE
ncbi:hypothetical protein J4G02_15050 [Candidatus Poribacteria bacterium]|nr:hypothetical protein [Candidatus Poribacteria bacterium]